MRKLAGVVVTAVASAVVICMVGPLPVGASVGLTGQSEFAPGNGVHPIAPQRMLDTRTSPAASAPVGQVPLTVQIAGVDGIPAAATAVVANITVTEPSIAGHVTVWPGGQPRPAVSNLNFTPGETVANLSVLALGADGTLNVVNANGTAHVIIDVMGWLSPSEPLVYVPELMPFRLADTRDGAGPLQEREARTFDIVRGASYLQAEAVLLNVTATAPTATTFVTASGAGSDHAAAAVPTTSTLNLRAGETRANLAIVGLGTRKAVSVYNNTGSTQIVLDVLGRFVRSDGLTTSGRIVPIPPARHSDTRAANETFGPKERAGYVFPRAHEGIPVSAMVFNVTVTNTTRDGFLTLYPWDVPVMPQVSNLNFGRDQTVANNAWVRLASEPKNIVGILNGSAGNTDVILDVQALVLG